MFALAVGSGFTLAFLAVAFAGRVSRALGRRCVKLYGEDDES